MEIITYKNSKYLQIEIYAENTKIDLGLNSVDEVSQIIEELKSAIESMYEFQYQVSGIRNQD